MRPIQRIAIMVLAACAAPAREQPDTSAPAASMNRDSSEIASDSTITGGSSATGASAPSRPNVEWQKRDSSGRILGRDRAKPIDVGDPKRRLPTIEDTAAKRPPPR